MISCLILSYLSVFELINQDVYKSTGCLFIFQIFFYDNAFLCSRKGIRECG